MPAVPTEHLDRKRQPQIPMTPHTVMMNERIGLDFLSLSFIHSNSINPKTSYFRAILNCKKQRFCLLYHISKVGSLLTLTLLMNRANLCHV